MTDNQIETDDRFPSGEWTGFFLQPSYLSERATMELTLSFHKGLIRGEGKDFVGEFLMRGHYDLGSGDVSINKQYVGLYNVFYKGCAELDKGLWGVWSLDNSDHGGFHIWPKGMADPTGSELHEAVDLPVEELTSVIA